MDKIRLDGAWTLAVSEKDLPLKSSKALREAGLKTIPAEVPGNLELDLHAAGLLPEPFFGLNVKRLEEVERLHAFYFRGFELELAETEGRDAVLLFEGLDCFAEVFLNGELVASCGDMLIEQRIALERGSLKDGANELFVHIRPAVQEALKYEYPAALFAQPLNYESLHVRKAPHMYGWDVMPRIVSAGLWRPVSLLLPPKLRIDEACLFTESVSEGLDEARLRLVFSTTLEPSPSGLYEIELEGSCGESVFKARAPLHFPKRGQIAGIKVERPKLWWPRGYGEPCLYDAEIRLLREGKAIHSLKLRHGVRSVELKRTKTTDERGNGDFLFLVNHERIFMKGSNWVPLDAFHSRDAKRLERAFEMVRDLDCDILRCWGGNVYESDRFFELCDEAGVCVWQDFALGCAVYPRTPELFESLEREARSTVRRLRQHPSLILWAGDNEGDSAFAWSKLGDPNRNAISRSLLPRVVWEEDPFRPFLPSSPFSDGEAWKLGESFIPEQHLWGPRDSFKSSFYKESKAHFASEIGYHGCPSPESIRKFISEESLWPWRGSEEWRVHSSCPSPDFLGGGPDSRNELMAKQIKELFGTVPEDLEGFAFASQCVQAEAKKFFIELFRSAAWRRTGIIWWNLLDGWPQLSDAIVDYYFERKLAYEYVKRSQRRICLMMKEPESWGQSLVAANATREGSPLKFSLRDVESGELLLSGERRIDANRSSELGRVPFSSGDKRLYLIEWEDSFGKGRNHYLAGLPPFSLERYAGAMRSAGLLAKPSWLMDSIKKVHRQKA